MKKMTKRFAVKTAAAVLAVTAVFSVSRMSAVESLAADAQQEATDNVVIQAAAAQFAGAIAATDETAAAAQADSVIPAPSDTDLLASANAAYAALGQVTSADIAVSISDATDAQKDSEEAALQVTAAEQAYNDAIAKANDLTEKAVDAGKAAEDAATWYTEQHTDADGNGIQDGEENSADSIFPQISDEMLASYCDAATQAANDRDAAVADANAKLEALNAANADLAAKMQIASIKYEAAVNNSGAVAMTAIAASTENNGNEAAVTPDAQSGTEEKPAEEAAKPAEEKPAEEAAKPAEEKPAEEAAKPAEDKAADTEEKAAEVSAAPEETEDAADEPAESSDKITICEARYNMDSYDRDLLAALVFYEANTEPEKGKIAVASVVLNRIRSSAYPDTLEGVIYQRSQFTPARKCAGMASTKSAPQSCYDAVDAALEGAQPVGAALHFMRRELHSGTVIQNHAFW